MNEQRHQAYLNLINQLLSCNDGDEPRILRENQVLLDKGLIEIMIAVSQQLEEAGRKNTAQWLMNIAQQLAQELRLLAQDYLNFLIETLQKVSENPNPQLIYPFWAQNLDKLDENLAQILDSWAGEKLTQVTPEQAYSIAAYIVTFSNLIQQFPLGNIATNKEIAIKGYEIVLTAVTLNQFPQDLAMVQTNLANAYYGRIRGERAENLERAIACYQEVLKVSVFDAFSQEWAMVQTNLANAYSERIRGERSENLERAIACYQEVLKVSAFDAFSQEWAMVQNNLANAYGERIRGERAENLEKAITCYQEALKVRTFDAFPQEWATTQNNLGEAYRDRIRGDKAENLERAIACYQEVLKVSVFDAFSQEWATTQNNLANAYGERIRGERAENLERAIAAYNLSLEVYTREAFPYEWARTQNNLGLAYSDRILGERADNLELAIATFNLSLEVYTRDAFPYEWAMTQNNLGIAYSDRIRGERADNLELAIAAYNLSLEVYTHEAFPSEWAMTQNNLGNAYRNRIRGERADNLELAIAAYNQSLEVRTRDAFPYKWARSQNNLGIAYDNRILGERADNLELAIAAYNLSLEVYARDSFPYEWATTQNNLGTAYSDRIRGERADNLELAIAAYNLSLEVRTRDAFPYEWAGSQNNLGNAYGNRIRGERVRNLELAIAAYNLSLEVRTREAFPYEWARSQNNLGIAYDNRILGERADNLELAIAAYNQSLEIYTRDAFPEDWARTQNNLGIAYSDRIRGERADNLELAIAAYNLSLEVYTPTAFPINCLQTGRNLGNTANLIEDWETAIKGYNLAIEAVENTRLQALNPQRQQEILSDAMDVYHGIVQSYLNLNQKDRALEYVERSKTRYLVQLLTDRDIYPKGNIPQTIITELDRLRRAIIGEEQQLAIQEQNRNRGVILTLDEQKQPILNDYTHLNHLKQELNQLIDRKITPIDPTFSLTQKVQTIPLTEIQSLIDQQTVILEWYISGDSIMAFVVTSQGLKVWQSSTTDRDKLINFIKDYREAYENNKTEWINNLNSRLNQLSEIIHIDELLELIPQDCDRLIIIPHWFLHIIPLHCLPLQNGQFLYQRFSKGVGYIPSCQLLKLVKLSQRENFDRLFAIKNPTRKDLKPLLGANIEIERISQGFDAEKTIIIGESEASEQTLENRRQELQAAHCIHFSCHGKFDNKSPRDSALMLADPEGNLGESANLTLAEVFEKLDLRECRLVTFSACESGIIESKADSISDEYVGLPSGFLFAGSSSVVSTLWTVDPLATTLFMTKFYHDLKRISIQDQGSIAIVLNNTQTWLRTLTSKKLGRIKNNSEFQKLLIEAFADNKRDRNKFKDLLEAAVKRQPYPFESPYYWTAFIATGV